MTLSVDPRLLVCVLGAITIIVFLPFLMLFGVARKYGVSFVTVLA